MVQLPLRERRLEGGRPAVGLPGTGRGFWRDVLLPQSAGEKKLPCREQVKCHARFQLKCQQFERFCGRARESPARGGKRAVSW